MKQGNAPVAVVRGGGDVATGVVQKLWRAGFCVAVLESASPTAIRRTVALSTAVEKGAYAVEDLHGVLVQSAADCKEAWQRGDIPVLVDETCEKSAVLRPLAVVDAIIAKCNIGMHTGLAPVTVALGPGFTAPRDADAVVETMRGHTLGRVITSGVAMPNTGVPGLLGGKTGERVVHAPAAGEVRHVAHLGDRVKVGDVLFTVGGEQALSPLEGTLRGLICEGITVKKGMKAADVDPRPEAEVDIYTISDKARAVGGAALEAVLLVARKKGLLHLCAGG